jgi:hypothetical protein
VVEVEVVVANLLSFERRRGEGVGVVEVPIERNLAVD